VPRLTRPLIGSQERVFRVFNHSKVYDTLSDQIAHLLRLRVLQELDVLLDRLSQCPSSRFNAPAIRKLSREEWSYIQKSGTIPYENAVAVLVVPPLNQHPETKVRPRGSMSPMPPPSDDFPTPKRTQLPLSVLMPTSKIEQHGVDVQEHAPHRVPLYNGVPLFSDRSQRAELHRLLGRLVAHEANLKYEKDTAGARAASGLSQNDTSHSSKPKSKSSHAYLLCSDANIVRRADVVPVAIALWRLRMFEGEDWQDSGGWYKRRRYRSMDIWY
jgi:hypothetical protein